jgi:hypothetical protein
VIAGGGVAGLAAARSLRLAGVHDFALLELEDTPGGNSRGGAVNGVPARWARTTCPCPGDHAPEVQDLLEELGLRQRVAGRWQYDERHLCHSPQERLYFEGEWQEGLLPVQGVGEATLAQYRRFCRRVGAASRAARFTMPQFAQALDAKTALAPAHQALDAMTFEAWLQQQGLDDAHLRWYLDYCCRDDYGAGTARVSAWAGMHYFASRHGFHAPGEAVAEDREGVLTWPEGNGWLTQQLAARAQGDGGQLRTAAACCALPRAAMAWRWMPSTTPRTAWSAGRHSAASWRCRCLWPRAWCKTRPHFCAKPRSACNGRRGWWPTSTSTRRWPTAPAPRPRGTTCSTAMPTPAAWAMWMPATSLDPRAVLAGPTVLSYYQALGDVATGPPATGHPALDALGQRHAGRLELSRTPMCCSAPPACRTSPATATPCPSPCQCPAPPWDGAGATAQCGVPESGTPAPAMPVHAPCH